jgi:hypothetical protein
METENIWLTLYFNKIKLKFYNKIKQKGCEWWLYAILVYWYFVRLGYAYVYIPFY